MTHDQVITIAIGSVVAGVVGLGFVAVRSLVARAIQQMDTMVHEIKKAQEEISRDFQQFRLEAAHAYATQVALEKAERENHASHANIHGRIDELSGLVIAVKTVQDHCKHCQGKI